MSDVTEPQSSSTDSPGAVLHSERRRQNFSIGDVSRHLKLSVRQVEALERDEYQIFGGPVFVHGFLRNYAKLLGLDASSLIAAADRRMVMDGDAAAAAENESHKASLEQPDADSAQRGLVPLFVTAAIIVVGVVGWMLTREDQAAPDEEPEAMVSQRTTDRADNSNTVPLTEPGAEFTTDDQEQSSVAPAAERAGPAAGAAAPQGPKSKLQFVFWEESWVEVTDRYGEVIFSQLNPAGASRTVSGYPPLSVVVGNADGVDLTYNEERIDLASHTRIDVARLRLE